ncbi:O-acetyl-ADP-ribose deacetylase 1 [Oryzias melastigma]|uniref:O-acetyl-ADP-ribose deacetylase 1 n=1 Tax=Oryzias melastigma TaxID=30732 RepID=A0A834BRR0_ORYME|nr:O-acetyl-ADP-ribose deacetylase 1 [Oryzias melastigma]
MTLDRPGKGKLHGGAVLPSAGQSVDDSWSLLYVSGDLFSCPPEEALAHCISEDCRMGAGIAIMFKRKFAGVAELKEQNKGFTWWRIELAACLCRVLLRSIGCGLDRLKWSKVAEILEEVFYHTNISITVYSLPEKTETTVMKENMRR